MSLIYRAIWQDDRPGLLDEATTTFTTWAREKHGEALIFEQAPNTMNGVETSLRRAEVEGVQATEATLIEDGGASRWMTRQRVIVSKDGGQWIWVDVERTTIEVFRQQDISAPRLVRAHLDAGLSGGGRPRVGDVLLRSRATAVAAERVDAELVSLIRDSGRTVPIVVFSHDERLEPASTMEHATTTQQILAGVAQVIVLTPAALAEFIRLMGRELATWGGAVRVYLPGPLDAWRHRYYLPSIVQKHPREVGRRIANAMSSAIAARRAPAPYSVIQKQLKSLSGQSSEELLNVAELELEERDKLIQNLYAQIEGRDEDLLGRAIDIEELNDELEAERRKTTYWRQVAQLGEEHVDESADRPDEVTSLSEAAELCRAYLSLVSLPDEAIRDLHELDSAPEATAWAKTSWRGFKALEAYASEAANVRGGFWEWCKNSKHQDTWPATPKKLSMVESDTVMNSAPLRSKRLLPVDGAVAPGGRIEMLAHLKVAEGGGSNIPRIYFYDDTKGPTGKIHVGFFGPHRYMENSKS